MKTIHDNQSLHLFTAQGAVTAKQRKTMFDTEMQHMTSVAKSLMESVSHAKIEFTSAKHHEHVRPMFKVCAEYVHAVVFRQN